MSNPTTGSLDSKLTQLKLGRVREVYPEWVTHASSQELSYAEFLEELLNEELLSRQENQTRRRLREAAFPYLATLDQFDFGVRPELKRSVMLRFFDSSFVEKAGALVLIGASGLGKTHLAIAVGTKMVQLGYGVRFITAQQLANGVLGCANREALERLLAPLKRCNLLILDEFGYLPLEANFGPVFYELISSRYEKGATIVTSNKSLAGWGELIGNGDNTLMMAVLDRLLHHGEVFYLRGSSYRTRGKWENKAGPGGNGNGNGNDPGLGPTLNAGAEQTEAEKR